MTRLKDFQRNAFPCYRFLKPEDFVHGSHISLRHKYLYVETPKVACSTIKRILLDAEYEGQITFNNPEYIHFREFSPLINPMQVGNIKQFLARPDIFKFCFGIWKK